jgi:hypothetical protein
MPSQCGLKAEINSFWFAVDLLEFVNHGAKTTMTIAGRQFIRDEGGEWREVKPN